jgi:hypothetical protein
MQHAVIGRHVNDTRTTCARVAGVDGGHEAWIVVLDVFERRLAHIDRGAADDVADDPARDVRIGRNTGAVQGVRPAAQEVHHVAAQVRRSRVIARRGALRQSGRLAAGAVERCIQSVGQEIGVGETAQRTGVGAAIAPEIVDVPGGTCVHGGLQLRRSAPDRSGDHTGDWIDGVRQQVAEPIR